MSLIEIIFGPRQGKPSEGLGGYDKREDTDLGLHVANCARRYDDLRRSIDRLQLLIWVVIASLLALKVLDMTTILALLT